MAFEGKTKRQKTDNPLPSTAANSSSAAGGKYQVFLSFSGDDTRKGFTDFLYTSLGDVGIRTFRDDDELGEGKKIGPDLLKAIQESKISIPIFSKNYASSKWCLRELAHMVKCHRTMGQKILPIFYDVEPSDVRHQTGCYEKPFLQHEKDFDENTVQGWKEALREVGEFKGWDLGKKTNGYQGKLVKMVVNKVLLELKKNNMIVTDNLVGMDHHVEKMRRFLNVGSNDVSIVGIHGMGGIGKTTIAKVIYNQLSKCFECCCFLTDVREKSQQNNGLDLQKQLISRILKEKCTNTNIVDVDEGINTIKDMVCRKKVLIILDDVDQKSQIDNLAIKRDWFGSGSRIIVTTRNKEVLDQLEVDETYEPPFMEPGHSLELFCRHAFRMALPPKDYDILSKKIVSTAAGLPLALEVIGSFLLGKGEDEWKELLTQLEEIPNADVVKKLKISYEALEHEQKEIFLDIACLFVGEDKKYPWYMWDACKFFPRNGINVLDLRSLVKIQDDMFMMHDHLRDLGREIVRMENFKNPGERSRLWRKEEVLYILEQKETKKVEALILERDFTGFLFGKSNLHLTDEEFGQLSKLRFLRVDGADLTGDFKRLLSELRWFEWHYGNLAPTNFHLKNLVVLRLSRCVIKDDTWSEMKMPQKLKVLHLSNCDGLRRIPDLSTCATLEVLILTWCKDLLQIDPSIGNLINLRELHMSYCGITELPDSIGNLKKLEEIDVSCCYWICSLPTSVCGLSRLQTLNSTGCGELKSLPELPHSLTNLLVSSGLTFPSLSNLVNLKELRFYPPHRLVQIPTDIGELSKLETLILYENNNINSLPAEIGALSQLKKLQVKFCGKLRFIFGLPSSLFALHLHSCRSLERLPDLSNLKNLSELRLSDCHELKGIQGLEQLESLIYLTVSLWKPDKRLLDLSNLKSLKELQIGVWDNLTEIRGLEELESLERLVLPLFHFIDLSNLENVNDKWKKIIVENPFLPRPPSYARDRMLQFTES